jgi:hypothetical protein
MKEEPNTCNTLPEKDLTCVIRFILRTLSPLQFKNYPSNKVPFAIFPKALKKSYTQSSSVYQFLQFLA